jgi:hypothetical protein
MFDSSGGPQGGTAYCPWGGKIGTHYLGLKFSVKGKTHFGWARVKIASMFPYVISLTGYAYETVPNKPILTGATKGASKLGNIRRSSPAALNVRKPATLGLLARGWPALSIWRRRESA